MSLFEGVQDDGSGYLDKCVVIDRSGYRRSLELMNQGWRMDEVKTYYISAGRGLVYMHFFFFGISALGIKHCVNGVTTLSKLRPQCRL